MEDIEILYRNTFQGKEILPSEAIWENIENQLSQIETSVSKTKTIKSASKKIIIKSGIASLSIIGAITAIILGINNMEENPPQKKPKSINIEKDNQNIKLNNVHNGYSDAINPPTKNLIVSLIENKNTTKREKMESSSIQLNSIPQSKEIFKNNDEMNLNEEENLKEKSNLKTDSIQNFQLEIIEKEAEKNSNFFEKKLKQQKDTSSQIFRKK